MSPVMVAVIGLIVLFVLMMLNMPISFSMFIVGFLGIYILNGIHTAFNVLTTELWNQFSSYTLTVIPLYILMGEFVFRSGVTEGLFRAAYKWVGQLKGGMAWTVIVASAGFAAICGSNSATAATMGTMALPELKKYKYKEWLSTGSVAAGGTLGIIIPPSTALLVIALQAELSVRALFVASIIPGMILTGLFLLTVAYICQRNPELGPVGPRAGWKEKFRSIYGLIPILLLFAFVIGGLFMGWFTPTESGAFGAFGALVIALMMRKMTREKFVLAVSGAIRASAMVITLIVGAMVFGKFLTLTRLPYEVADWTSSLQVAPVFILIAILLIYVIGGSLMDALGFLVISIPIFYPTIISIGYDPVWFAVILCMVTSMGAITPPVGVNVFVVKGIAPDVSIISIFKGACIFLLAYVLCLTLLIVFPGIVTFLI